MTQGPDMTPEREALRAEIRSLLAALYDQAIVCAIARQPSAVTAWNRRGDAVKAFLSEHDVLVRALERIADLDADGMFGRIADAALLSTNRQEAKG